MFDRSIEKPRSPRATRRETLLVVDDQAANIQVLYRALSAHYEIFMALSGTQAIAMCRDNPPDLVLLDVVMPETDGYQVCQCLKAAASTRDIPIIFVTANDDPLEEARGLELGAVDFITKPVSPAVVRARVRTHLELARARLQLTATLEATADGILVTDLDGFIGTLNRRFADMWDMPHDLLEREGSASVAAHMRALRVLPAGSVAATATKEPPGEFMDIEVEGGRHYERHTRPLQSNGRLQGHVYSFRDVTQQRKDALALTRFNEVLEARIRERTQELEQARQVADAASMAKSNLLSNMSHELRTPLNSILGMAHLALKREPDAPTGEYLRKMSRSGEHLLRLLNDVLDFARLDAGKLELALTDFTLGSLFDEIAGQLVSAAENKGLELTFRIDPALRRSIRGDVHRLKQVLLNYVGNAIKFSESGRITVQARLEAHDDSGATLRFDVQDQGIGIAPEQVGSLFQSFHQADASDTRKYDGAGLGLAIAKRLASKMNGEVGVDSRLGAGSTFWLRVTLGWEHASSLAESGTSAPADLDTPGLQGHTILVVDDNSFNRLVATDLLLAAGAKTFVAANGQEALDMLAKHSFACVLMDVQMPVMDGLEATRRIRADPALRTVRIVAMTANVRTENRLECLAAGMDDFLTKPVIPDLLYKTLSTWIAAGPYTGAADDAHSPQGGAASADAGAAATPTDAVPSAALERHVAPDASAACANADDEADLSVLSAAVGGDPDKTRKFALMFVDTMSKTLTELDGALVSGDLAAVSALGHRAKSSAATVGAAELARLCQSLQDMKGQGNIEDARETVRGMASLNARITDQIARTFA